MRDSILGLAGCLALSMTNSERGLIATDTTEQDTHCLKRNISTETFGDYGLHHLSCWARPVLLQTSQRSCGWLICETARLCPNLVCESLHHVPCSELALDCQEVVFRCFQIFDLFLEFGLADCAL